MNRHMRIACWRKEMKTMSKIGWVAALLLGIAVGLSLATQVVQTETELLPAVSSAAPNGGDASASSTDPDNELIEVVISQNKRVFYQYIDGEGAVRFVESPYDIPEEWRDRAGRVELNVAPPNTPAEARMARKLQDSLE